MLFMTRSNKPSFLEGFQPEASFKKYYPNLILASVITLVFFLTFNKILDTDVHYHLSVGKYIVENGSIPKTDIFSYPNINFPVQNDKWLFQCVLYLLHNFLGVGAFYLVKTGVPILIIFCLAWGMEFKRRPLLAGVILFFSAFLIAPRAAPRPDLVSLLFLSIFISICAQVLKEKIHRKWLWALPVLQVLWVNIHGYYMLGVMMVVCLLIACLVQKKEMIAFAGAVLGAVVLACFVNPYFVKGALYSLTYAYELRTSAGIISHTITETQAINFKEAFISEGNIFDFKPYLALLALSGIFLAVNWKKPDIFSILFFALLGALSVSMLRFTSFVGIAAPIAIANAWECEWWGSLRSRLKNSWGRDIKILHFLGVLLLPLCVGYQIWNLYSAKYYRLHWVPARMGWGLDRTFIPVDAVNFIESSGLKGPMFNNFGIGSYLAWRFFPKEAPLLHTSSNYNIEFWNMYLGLIHNPPLWKSTLNTRLNYCILGVRAPSVYELRAFLHKQNEWVLVYIGEDAVIFARDIPENKNAIKKYRVNVRTRLREMLQHARNKISLRRALKRWSASPDTGPIQRIGILAEDLGESDTAEEALLYAWSLEPTSIQLLNRLSIHYYKKGDDRLATYLRVASLTANKWSIFYERNLHIVISTLAKIVTARPGSRNDEDK